MASQVTFSGGPAIQRSRLLDEAEGTGPTAALDTDLIEYYQLLAEKGDVQAQVRIILFLFYFSIIKTTQKDLLGI